MIHRRATILAGLSVIGFQAQTRDAAAQLSAPDRADLARIEAYLNSVRTLKAHFVQVAPDGGISQGEAVMQRPGKMRFQYDPPSPYLLIANYGILFFHDSQLNQTTNIPLGRTPLGLLLGDQVTLSGDVAVTRFVHLPGQFQVTLVRTGSPGDGSLTLLFSDNPIRLKQWTVLDQQGKQTRVTFTDLEVGVGVDAKLFDYRNVSSSATGGG